MYAAGYTKEIHRIATVAAAAAAAAAAATVAVYVLSL